MGVFNIFKEDTYYSDEHLVRELRNDKLKGRIKTIMILLIFVMIVILSRSEKITLWFILFGAIIAAFGIVELVFAKGAYPEERIRPLSSILAGAAVIVLVLFFTEDTVNGSLRRLPVFFSIIPMIVGFFSLMGVIVEAVSVSAKKRRCTQAVTASCLDIIEKHMGRGKNHYLHIWEYDFEGERILASDRISCYIKQPYVGESEKIMINPEDPRDIYRSVPTYTSMKIFTGLAVTVMSVGYLVYTLSTFGNIFG